MEKQPLCYQNPSPKKANCERYLSSLNLNLGVEKDEEQNVVRAEAVSLILQYTRQLLL